MGKGLRYAALAATMMAGLGWAGGASADVFPLNIDNCTGSCLATGDSASVTVTASGGTLAFDVALTGDLFFQHTTGLTDFLFNLSGGPAITITGLTSGFATIPTGGSETAGSIHEDGFGQFMYGLDFTGASGTVQELKFTVADAGTLTLADLTASSIPPGNSSVLFSADVADVEPGGTTTGPIGGSVDITTFSGGVPEASTWAMMLIGFAGLGFAGFRRSPKLRLERAIT